MLYCKLTKEMQEFFEGCLKQGAILGFVWDDACPSEFSVIVEGMEDKA